MEKKKTKRRVITIIIIVAVIAAMGVGITSCVSGLAESAADYSMSSDETTEVQKQNLSKNISVSGTVGSGSLVKVTSTAGVKIQSLNVKVGDYVNEGDILCVFDKSDIQKEYDNLKSTIDMSDEMSQNTHNINQRNLDNAIADKQTSLNQAQRAIDDAENSRDNAYEKYNSLVDKCNEYSSRKNQLYDMLSSADEEEYQDIYQQYQEYEQLCSSTEAERDSMNEQLASFDSAVQSAYDAYYAAERSADSAIQGMQDTINAEKFNKDTSSQSQLDALAEKLEDCTVTAPKSGIITSLNVAEGSIPTTDALMTIEDTSSLKVSVQIKEADILNVKEGLKAVIKTDATGDAEINGTVSRVVNILSGADEANQQAGGYTAEISIDDADSSLLIGMNAKVKIILDEKNDVLAVPYDAIVQDDDGKSIVYIAEKDSDGIYKAKSVTVETGMETDYYTEIVSGDLKEGDILISQPEYAYDGKTVSVSDNSVTDVSDGE